MPGWGQALHSLVVPAVNVTRCQTKVFKTPHAAGSRGDEEVRAVDVAMATSAAPAYFSHGPRGRPAVCRWAGCSRWRPTRWRLHEAEHFMGVDASAVRMLSLGTGTLGYQPAEGFADDAGAVGWLSDGRLLLTLISVQQQHVQAMMEDQLGKRYLRLDAPWPPHAGLGIDVATPASAQALVRMADDCLRDVSARQLARFLGERASDASPQR